MPKYTSKFNDRWLDRKKHPTWTWLKKVDGDNSNARCSSCDSNFAISNMGVSSISSHKKGKKHISQCVMKLWNHKCKHTCQQIKALEAKKARTEESAKDEAPSLNEELKNLRATLKTWTVQTVL